MARLIDADELLKNSKTMNFDGYDSLYYVEVSDIHKAPTIEVEPVVYCKYCIRWQKDKTYNLGYCDIIDGHTNPKNFCCWGEESPFRKKDGK